ncbi:hypothetical protein yberc0001_5730 [Yersinia bercovieri ATCC 43970]|uniref:Uncharacterized protein n=1 Tax=Yersinia bercovieri ATCC 43970 TaxID=349968 RepID=A0ABM9XVJ0_YERBE|nr:hypothetical protein yberc0001_5730 [Yersinia bercovieri ATCC 43970]
MKQYHYNIISKLYLSTNSLTSDANNLTDRLTIAQLFICIALHLLVNNYHSTANGKVP